jgi:protein-tyrosine-phosphatase
VAQDLSSKTLPQSVLFCCDHNAVRSPMAEGIMKKFYGTECYIQSVGVKSDLEIDGFAVAVCAEIGVELSRHRSRSFDQMEDWGDDLSSFDLVLALSPASQRRALDLTQFYHLDRGILADPRPHRPRRGPRRAVGGLPAKPRHDHRPAAHPFRPANLGDRPGPLTDQRTVTARNRRGGTAVCA